MDMENPEHNLVIPPSWPEATARLKAQAGLTLVLGATDTGKSSFCAFLLGRLCREGGAAGFVDADLGQSTLGPPMAVGAKSCASPEDVGRDLWPPILQFVGSPTPDGHLAESLVALAKVVERVRCAGPRRIVVDTTGLVEGDSGRRLKALKVQLLRPEWIVALQRADELEPLLSCFERQGRRILRLQSPPEARPRSREQRRRRRLAAYAEYFAHANPSDIAVADVAIHNCPANLAEAFGPASRSMTTGPVCPGDSPIGLLAGLNGADGETLAVGRVTGVDWAGGRLTLLAPRIEAASVRLLHFASGAEPALENIRDLTSVLSTDSTKEELP